MQFKTKRRQDPVLEITPLIDVVFLLLLFFMVTTQFISLPGVKVNLPGIEAGSSVSAATRLDLTVTAAGDIYLSGQPVAEADVGPVLAEKAYDAETTVVVISADESVPHGRIVNLMDQVRRSGLTRVVLAARWNEEQ